MKKFYYAIKIGNNVKNLIVENWEECKKYVIGYPAIYKKFKERKSALKFLKSINDDEIDYLLKWNDIYKDFRLKNKIE